MKSLAAESRRSIKEAQRKTERKEAKREAKGKQRGKGSAKQRGAGIGRQHSFNWKDAAVLYAMDSSSPFRQEDQWSLEINVDPSNVVLHGPPIVPFRNLRCGRYRINYTFGGGSDGAESLVLALENVVGDRFYVWSPASVCELADCIEEARFIDFVGYGRVDDDAIYEYPPVVIRLAHRPEDRPDYTIFTEKREESPIYAKHIRECFDDYGASSSNPDKNKLIRALREALAAGPHGATPSPSLAPIPE